MNLGDEAAAGLPLAGITVLELTQIVMGPSCGLVLADLGADVIRIEPAPNGDPTRRRSGFTAGSFRYFNRNKRCLCIDLKSPDGRAVALDLVGHADVLVENYGPGTLDRLGLGWEAVHAKNPRLVYCALKGFLPGPYGHRPALDEVVQYMAGLAYMTGPLGMPLRAGASIVDITGGVMGAVAILAALRQRDSDGRGRKVTSALFESAAFFVAQHMAGEAATGIPALPMPARRGAWAIYETFDTADGEKIYIAITSDNQWRAFCENFGLAEVLSNPRLRTNEDRVQHRDEARKIVAEVAASRTVAELSEIFDRIGVPFSPVRRPGDLFEDPQLNAPGRMLRIRMPDGKIAKLPPLPIEIDGATLGLRRQAAEVGEHTDEVLRALGYSAARIAELRRANAIR